MHVSVTHAGEMQTLEELELESAVGRFGDLWERAREPIDPQLQVAALENTAERSETCPDYKANCIHTQTKQHTHKGGRWRGVYTRAIIVLT